MFLPLDILDNVTFFSYKLLKRKCVTNADAFILEHKT